MWVATYSVEADSFRAERPRPWSLGPMPPTLRSPAAGALIRAFDLHPDGQRFAVLGAPEELTAAKRDHVVLIQNFFDELRRIAPAGNPR